MTICCVVNGTRGVFWWTHGGWLRRLLRTFLFWLVDNTQELLRHGWWSSDRCCCEKKDGEDGEELPHFTVATVCEMLAVVPGHHVKKLVSWSGLLV